MKTLVVVESPAKTAKIGGFLGGNYIVKASFGHIRGIANGLKGINFGEDYKITYDVMDAKKKAVAELRKCMKECSDLIIASDPDREGEAIGFHVAIVLGKNPRTVKRISFQEITKKAVLAAVAKPGNVDMNLVFSQEARCVLDLLVGYEISPVLSQIVGGKLSAGRCQSPSVRLVAEREDQISKTAETSYYRVGVRVYPETDSKLIVAGKMTKKYTDGREVEALLAKIADGGYFEIDDYKTRLVQNAPPKPFTTSSVQQDCSAILGMNPKDTMATLQKLYEGGKITYMRTDSVVLSEEAMDDCGVQIQARYGSDYQERRLYKNKDANAQEAHEAIRPTHMEEYPLVAKGNEEWNARQARVYELVWKRTMASQMANQRTQRHTTKLALYTGKPVAKKYTADYAECVINQVEFDGWRVLYTKADNNPEEPTEEEDEVSIGVEEMRTLTTKPTPKLFHKSVEGLQQFERAVGRYTEASLIKDLESKGIGRPSTYAYLMGAIQERGYVETRDFKGEERELVNYTMDANCKISKKKKKTTVGKEKKKLTITPLGQNMVAFMLEHFGNIVDYEFTKSVEKELDAICSGKARYSSTVDKVYKSFHPKVVELKGKGDRPIRERRADEIVLGDYDQGDGREMPITVKHGPYGAYLNYDGVNYSLKYVDKVRADKIVEEGDIEVAAAVIDEIQESKKKREEAKKEEIKVGKYTLKKGPYGYYFTVGKKNYGIGERDPNSLKEDDFKTIMEQKKQWMGKKKTG